VSTLVKDNRPTSHRPWHVTSSEKACSSGVASGWTSLVVYEYGTGELRLFIATMSMEKLLENAKL
jgi:hypothetical protein